MKIALIAGLLVVSNVAGARDADESYARAEAVRQFLAPLVGEHLLQGAPECASVKISILKSSDNSDPHYDYTCITVGEEPNFGGWTCLYSPDVDMGNSCDVLSDREIRCELVTGGGGVVFPGRVVTKFEIVKDTGGALQSLKLRQNKSPRIDVSCGPGL